MAQQIINDAITCLAGSGITAGQADLPVALADGGNVNDPTPTVIPADATNSAIYGKMETTIPAVGDATDISSTDNTLTYPLGANVIVDGIVEFTTATAIGGSDVGKGVEGDASGNVAVAATGGTGKIVARNGTTIWVDLRA